MEVNKVYVGNNIDILKTFPDNSIDSIVTDPPYGLGKEPEANALLKDWLEFGYHEVKGKGFMGKEWDAFVPQPIFWKECYRVLKHGGHVLSFAGTRTYDWMVLGLRLSGFEIRDQLAWIYGSGFPKSHDVSKAIDKRGGQSVSWFGKWLKDWRTKNDISQKDVSILFPSKTGGLTGCVANWELGLNMPTVEQFNKICQHFNLPFDSMEEAEREVVGKYETDMGGLGGERLGSKGGDITAPATDQAKEWQGWGTALKPALEPIVMARKPLDGTVADNVLKHGVGGINIDGCRVATNDDWQRDEQETNTATEYQRKNKSMYAQKSEGGMHDNGRFPANVIHDGSDEVVALFPETTSGELKSGHKQGSGMFGKVGGDSGSAARFFYTAKASQGERNYGLGGFDSDVTTDGRTKPIDNAFNRGETERKNIHPTVKPIDLMRYLVRLVTPKGGVCLDPFLGSGTTAVAAKAEKFDYIGIELQPEYAKIAQARIKAEIVQYDIYDVMED